MDEECEEEEQEDDDYPEEPLKQDSLSVKLKVTEDEDVDSSPDVIENVDSESESYEHYLNSITKGANAEIFED